MTRRFLPCLLACLVFALLTQPFWQPSLRRLPAQEKTQAPAGDRPLAFVGAKVHTVSGPVIEDGLLVTFKGKIQYVGPNDKSKIPANAVVRNVTGKVIIPGLVDSHSHVGIFPRPQVPAHSDGNESTGPIQPGLRALDAIHTGDPGIRMALAGGVTTANIMPGSGNPIGGQTLYVKFRGGLLDLMRVLTNRILGGMKFANGENPKGYGSKGAAPGTRMKVAALQRETLVKAQAYKKAWDKHKADPKSTAPERDIAMEPLVECLEKRRTVHFHCHRADDIMTALRLSEEFGFEIVLQHCTEGYRIADELGKRKAWVSLTLIDSPGGKPEAMGLLEENAAVLVKAGALVAINTDDFITESRFLLRTGAIALRGGMTEAQALAALTLNPATMMHLEDRLGHLKEGLDADFVILSGAPFSVYTHVLETYIDGELMFDRGNLIDSVYQTGGFALPNQGRLPTPAAPMKAPSAAKIPTTTHDFTGNPKTFAILAGRIHTVTSGTIEDGVIVVEDGKIKSVGTQAGFKMPKGMNVVVAAEVTPGLIDAQSVVGLAGALNVAKADLDHDEKSDSNQADLRVLDSFNPQEPLLQFIREQGVTIVHASPGVGNVIGGQTGLFRTYGRTAEGMTLKFPAGILMNLGESVKGSGKFPSTRMGTANLVRTALSQAQAYSKKKEGAKEAPPINLKHEALEGALKKKYPVFFAAHRSSDIATALRLAEEFGVEPVLSLATEGYLIADVIAQSKAKVVVHPTMQRPATMETFNGQLGNAGVLADKKLSVSMCTAFEGYVPKTRVLRFEAAMAMVNGLGFERALRSITLEPAQLFGIADRFGSVEPGKVADLILYDGNPFEHSTHVTYTIVGGKVIYDRSEYLKLPFERRALPLSTGGGGEGGCCLGW